MDRFHILRTLEGEPSCDYYSLPAFEELEGVKIQRLPISVRILLESLLRNCDGKRITEEHVRQLAHWSPQGEKEQDVPFIVARVLLQDFTGVPLLVDLAAMRDAIVTQGGSAALIEPQVPVDLVVDHSVQVDVSGSKEAFNLNLEIEFSRNRERYTFFKWGQEAFKALKVIPPGIGIVHQVNLEYLATVVSQKEESGRTILFPDSLVGTDSHTTMINGLGVVGWGVGGIEAEASMLGQPAFIQMPEVIGVHLAGKLKEGVTATDLTLRITEMLRKEKVVGKFVEFFGEGAASLTVADRATIGNMAPEYGATMGFFPADDKTLEYLKMTGRAEPSIARVRKYLVAQQLFGIPKKGEVDYSHVLELDLSNIVPSVAGPKRPQDRIDLSLVKEKFHEWLSGPTSMGGYDKKDRPKVKIHKGDGPSHSPHTTGGKPSLEMNSRMGWSEVEMVMNRPFTESVDLPEPTPYSEVVLTHGSVVIAAITSCTNTSNPSVMLAAGLLARKAVAKGLSVSPKVKTSLAPGSRVVTDYLVKTGLQKDLDALGFELVAYGCTTCIGNSGPLDENIERAIKENDLITVSVLSGNRNFEARIHSAVKANFLMSPPLVVAFAIAGRVDIDMNKEPLGYDQQKNPVFLQDIWPTSQEVQEAMALGVQSHMFKERYANVMEEVPLWKEIVTTKKAAYSWNAKNSYIQKPPYFEGFDLNLPQSPPLHEMRPLAFFGDSVTTDHISPAGSIRKESPAGHYLLSLGIKEADFNSYGSRRGNHHVMVRGTFANVRLRNQLADGKEGGYTKLMPEGVVLPIFDACQIYAERKTPLIIFAGKDYGMGSSRDWAAKGTALLGVKAVVASSFERIHRSNLVGMGVFPLQFQEGEDLLSLQLSGEETFSLKGIEGKIRPRQKITLEIFKEGTLQREVVLLSRIDTSIEVEYYRHGGILPFVLRQLLNDSIKVS